MSGFEFPDEPYPKTSRAEMDPVMRSQIIALAEEGADQAELEEIFGPENVRLAANNDIGLTELLEHADSTEGSDDAA